jgi:hypothetical protein
MPASLADELVMRTFIRVLKPTPPADIVHQDEFEIGVTAPHIRDERLEGVAAVSGDAAAPYICVRPHDGESPPGWVTGKHVALVRRRIFLPVRRHVDIFDRASPSVQINDAREMLHGGQPPIEASHDRASLGNEVSQPVYEIRSNQIERDRK